MSYPVLFACVTALCAASSSVVAQRELPAKMVAAPAAEVLAGKLRLPHPADSADSSRSAWMLVRPDALGQFELSVPVEGNGELELALLAAHPERLTLRVAEPHGELRSIAEWVADGTATQHFADLNHVAPGAATLRTSISTQRRGAWTVRVEASGVPTLPSDTRAALLLVASKTSLRLVTHLANWELTQTGAPALLCELRDTQAPEQTLLEAAWSAELEVRDALGGHQALRFHDDGQHADGAANDGLFGVWLPTTVPGTLDLRVIARGSIASGEFLRTSQLRVPLHATPQVLNGEVRARVIDPLHLELALGMQGAASATLVQVSAEVWSRQAGTPAQPVAWLSTMTSSEQGARRHAGQASLLLSLDLRWLARTSSADGALELRNVRVQDRNTHVPLSQAERLSVPPVLLPDAAFASPGPITAGMLTGSERVQLSSPPASSAPGHTISAPRAAQALHSEQLPSPPPPPVRALMLVHGYCSGLAWNPAHFTGERLVFMDPNQSRSHDEFAQLIANTGLAADSFGVIGHSQGGSAALHLFTFYMSGLDFAQGPRRIQSVGTPYQGTPLAGNLAVLGDIFGTGCGTNFDLSTDGSALWLASIPNWARAEVHYWSTSTGGFWCNFVTNLVLDNPEDGVVEMTHAQLAGATNHGHKTGWCHTTGMNDPAQYFDTVRNTEMDTFAAR